MSTFPSQKPDNLTTLSMSWTRTVYMYLFALVGLTLIIIGSVLLVDLGLKITIFKQADQEYPERPPFPPSKLVPAEFREDVTVGGVTASADIRLTKIEQEQLEQWQENYRFWEERQLHANPVRSRHERTASRSTAMLVVGIPLFLYHWKLIARTRKTEARA